MTQKVFQLLVDRASEHRDSWANAEFLHDPIQNAVAVGYCKAIEDFTKISCSEIDDAE